MSIGFHIVQQEVAEKAMRAYRAKQAVRERRSVTGGRKISREEAAALVAKKNPRGALRLIHSVLGGRTVR